MRQKRKVITMLAGLTIAMYNTGQAQVLNNLPGQYWLTPSAPTPSTFSIGNAPNIGFALDIHGEQMNPPLGNVFKTNGPDDMDTYWRMFRGGKEYGNIFNLTAKFSTFPLLFSHSIKLINL